LSSFLILALQAAGLLQEATWQTGRPDFAMIAGLRFGRNG